MKRTLCSALVVMVAVVVAVPAVAQAEGDLRLNLSLTWDLGFRVGVDYRPWDHVGFVADIGSTLFSFEEDGGFVLTGNALVMVHAYPPTEPLQLSAGFGVTDWRVVFVDPPATEISFGVSGQVAYDLEGWGLFLRAGAGLPLFWEGGDFSVGDTAMPLGLWPDLTVGAKIDL
ncbi:MAG: hypothetical protein ACOC0E_07960 [Spirochaetota bacterium]